MQGRREAEGCREGGPMKAEGGREAGAERRREGGGRGI